MLKIFAKKDTNEKVLMYVPNGYVKDVLEKLNNKFGRNWLWVDSLKPGEALSFTDNMVYQGYTPDIERYSSNIIKLD